jgi:hypothetical protein
VALEVADVAAERALSHGTLTDSGGVIDVKG